MSVLAQRIKKRNKIKHVWTFEFEALLVRLWHENQPVNEICRQLRKSKAAIHSQANKLQLPRRNKKDVIDVIEGAKEKARDSEENELAYLAECDRRLAVYDWIRLGKTIGQTAFLTGFEVEYVRERVDELLKGKLIAPGENGTFVEYDPQLGNRVKKPSTEYKGTQREGNIRRIPDPRMPANRRLFR